jgi:CheY-like chemotaxis protein
MDVDSIHILLADDDADDCLFFKEALDELPVSASLAMVNDGAQLMEYLESSPLPDLLFLDLNMPKKTGFECLTEINQKKNLKEIKVIIFSTHIDPETLKLFHARGAHYFIRKPTEFAQLKKVISNALQQATVSPAQGAPDKIIVIKP